MQRALILCVSLLVVAGLAACGSGGGGESIGCDWFEGSNCYKDTLAAAIDCLPDDAGPDGTLSADSATCTYDDGTQIVFHNPFDPDAMDNDTYLWDVEVISGGQTCIRVTEGTGGDMTVTTPAGDYVQTTSGFSMRLTCPDGVEFKVSNALKLFECENMLDILPGHTTYWADDFVGLSLMGGPDGALPLFDCSR